MLGVSNAGQHAPCPRVCTLIACAYGAVCVNPASVLGGVVGMFIYSLIPQVSFEVLLGTLL